MINLINFKKFIQKIKPEETFDFAYLYEVFSLAYHSIEELSQSGALGTNINIDEQEIIYYLLGEYFYALPQSEKLLAKFKNDEKIMASMAGVVADKYVSLSSLSFMESHSITRYNPPISSFNVYLNFMMKILSNYHNNNPESTLITDLLIKSISIARCILKLLIEGYETEAFSSWRTLHECECTLLVLDKYGDSLIKEYLKHMQYGIIFEKKEIDNERSNAIFNMMKEELKSHDLKSKDIKKFIEYGWLYKVVDDDFKLNFRDGLEKFAGLQDYKERYELSSEIIHSTPILIYSNKEYFYYLSLLSTYESFFRLENVFVHLFIKSVNNEQLKRYQSMRNLYYSQLINIHKRESLNFNKIYGKK